MSDEYYEQLADRLGSLPNGFPRTQSGVEIRLLKKILKPNEARYASLLTMEAEPVEALAERFGLSAQDTARQLQVLMLRGVAWTRRRDGKQAFRLAPFVVGFYESQRKKMDHELAHLFEEYMMQGGARGILGPEPPIHRVVPSQKVLKTEEIMPYDDVRTLLSQAKAFNVHDCICRIERSYAGHECKFPVHICLNWSMVERAPMPDDVSKEEALAILDQAAEVGLVHTVSNVAEGWGYVCNCCSCCCAILRGITDFGIENSVAKSSYYAVVDAEHCVNCQLCYDRCHVKAIAESDDAVAAVDVARCIGCGLCVMVCLDEAIRLQKKPDAEIVAPPAKFSEWERARLANRAAVLQ